MSSGLFREKVEIDGWIFYIITPGTIVYRGNALEYIGNKDLTDLEYFSNLETAEIYGPVVRYEVKTGLKLLAMDELSNLARLFNEANSNVQMSLTSSFGYSLRKPRIKRDSDYDMDKNVAQFICSKGLDGYAHEPIESNTMKDFHPEIALCSPGRKIKRIENVPYRGNLENAVRENRLHVYAAEERRARKKPSREISPPERGRTLFGEDDNSSENDEEESPPKRRILF